MLISKGVFKSNERVYHETCMRHPLNAFSSFCYLLPIYHISSQYEIINYYGILILGLLTPVSFMWWATSHSKIKYIDNSLVVATQIWILSYIYQIPLINFGCICLFDVQDDKLFRNIGILLSLMILYANTNYISRYFHLHIPYLAANIV